MERISFSQAEKAAFFDQIAARYYERNFGQLSKAEMDTLMFRFYIEKQMESSLAEDGTIDYNQCSDYRISKELGITQQRVRNLKIKHQLAYPRKLDWKVELAKLTKNARYDQATHKVTLSIPDPNLYLEIQNFIEEQGAYVEKQLNSKLLQIRAEYYIELMLTLEPETNKKAIIKELRKFFAQENKTQEKLDEKNIGKSLLDAAVNVTEVAANISGRLSTENPIGAALIELLTKP